MAETTFKIPSLPAEEMKSEDDKPTTSSTVEQEEISQSTSANCSTIIRHKNLQYNVPESSAIPPFEYTLEIIRNGSIIDHISLSQRAYTVFGRSPDSDVVLEHPTISRYHAVIQYKSEFEHGQSAGLYLYDCGSTHGTFINKKRLESKIYVRIKVGYIIKFGQSTRLYIVQGDSIAESDVINNSIGDDLTHEQMKQFHVKRAKMIATIREKRENDANEMNHNNNIEMDWGMGPEIDETTPMTAVPSSTNEDEIIRNDEEKKKQTVVNDLQNRLDYKKAKNDQSVLKEIMSRVDEPSQDDENKSSKEPFYLKDPKRALTTFFEREGAELSYDVENHFGSFRCTIKLPIVDEYGRAIQAECEQKNCKRKEIIDQCIIEACRILDEQGVLREGTSSSLFNTPRIQQIKRQLLEENDFYEEDEDTFYDRTGDLEKKRLKRMEWTGHLNSEKQVETFDSLCLKLKNLYNEQVDLEQKLETAKQMEENVAKNTSNADKDVDEIDLYIRQLKQGEKVNLKLKFQWRKRLLEIENEERQFAKLLRACKPKDFEIQKWKQNIREEAKLNLIPKSKPIPPPPPPPAPLPVNPIVEKTEEIVQTLTSVEPKIVQPLPQENISTVPSKSTIRRKVARSSKNSKDQMDDSDHYSEDKFSEWMPPENEQTGDGRTALNEKYGY